MKNINICVFGASSSRINETYLKEGYQLGRQIALQGWGLIYGAGATGMMGAAAKGALSENGKVTGISPKFFDQEGVLLKEGTEIVFTDTMRERKALMESSSEGFIVTPGGIGTLEEFLEILTLKQLGQLNKPICLFNCEGCYDYLIDLLKDLVTNQFMSEKDLDLFYTSDDISQIIAYLKNSISDRNEKDAPEKIDYLSRC